MEVALKIEKNGRPQEGVSAIIVDGPASWAEIAALTNENGQLSLPVEKPGKYSVKIFSETGEKIVSAPTGKEVLIELNNL